MAVQFEPLPTLAKFDIAGVLVITGEVAAATNEPAPTVAHMLTVEDLRSLGRQIDDWSAKTKQ